MTLSAGAQMHIGGSFNINIDNEFTNDHSGESYSTSKYFEIRLAPKIYWNITAKFRVGTRIGFSVGHYNGSFFTENSEILSDVSNDEPIDYSIDRAIGWAITPFCGYHVLDLGRLHAWIDANLYFGQDYNTSEITHPELEWKNKMGYGFQILPAIDIDISDKTILQLHIGLISLGWYGSTYKYENKTVTNSSLDMHKGGVDGVLQGLIDYGIGLVRTF